MGMFDYIVPECELPDEAARSIKEWQTKAFDMPWMDTYRITKEGRLMHEVYHTEDRSDKSAPPGSLESVRGIFTKVHEGWGDTNYHGYVEFVGALDNWKGEYFRYRAKFTDGQLMGIERLPEVGAALSVQAPSSKESK